MFERGIFTYKYKDIIEIYPHKVTNGMVFDAVLLEIEKDYNLVQMFPGWIRAFKKHEKGA
jgi:NADH:ubiquinone oxidoreductase subunit F (NADH-binding)